MRTVNEVCRLTGLSARALHYYDSIGLLKPSAVTEAGYRLYDDDCIERLGQIMLFKELGFNLKDIKKIIENPDFDKGKALDEQIKLLSLKKERIEGLISFAKDIKRTGEYKMDFKAFDKKKIDSYAAEAKKKWGNTDAYREFDEKTADYSDEKKNMLADEMMKIFKELGTMKDRSPADKEVREQIKKLQNFITENYYTCTDKILAGLGQMYSAGGKMTDNIDKAGGKGTAGFTAKAIEEYNKSRTF